MPTCRIVNTVIVPIELGYIDIIVLQYKLINLKEIAFLKGGCIRTLRAPLATGLGATALGAACKKYTHAELERYLLKTIFSNYTEYSFTLSAK